MELVIDITEHWEEKLSYFNDRDVVIYLVDVIKNGTPLDKHDEEVIKETVESIWGKPPYTELLDKIRAEIIQERESNTYGEYDKIFELCLLIIDKYKAESEEVK